MCISWFRPTLRDRSAQHVGWEWRASEFAAAAVEIIAGALLIARPNQLATLLEKHNGA